MFKCKFYLTFEFFQISVIGFGNILIDKGQMFNYLLFLLIQKFLYLVDRLFRAIVSWVQTVHCGIYRPGWRWLHSNSWDSSKWNGPSRVGFFPHRVHDRELRSVMSPHVLSSSHMAAAREIALLLIHYKVIRVWLGSKMSHGMGCPWK